MFRRNETDGSFLIDESGNKILDADFEKVLSDIRSSPVASDHSWLSESRPNMKGWALPISMVLKDGSLTMDPKRYCKKFVSLREQIEATDHFALGDILEPIAEQTTSSGKKVKKDLSKLYNHVELDDIGRGEFVSHPVRGWKLPDRAKHFAEKGDIYLGAIWGSVQKWCVIGDDNPNYVFTNGCYRMRLKPGKEQYLVDMVAFIVTDGYATQMRALARGSDGLAEVTVDDVMSVLVPKIREERIKQQLVPFVNNILTGKKSLSATVSSLISAGMFVVPQPAPRPNHTVLV